MDSPERTFLHMLRTSSTEYLRLNLTLLKLNVYEKTGRLFSLISYSLAIMWAVSMAAFFILMTLAFALSYWTGSVIAGFGLVAAMVTTGCIMIYLYRDRIKHHITNIIITTISKRHKDEQRKSQL